MVHPGFASCLWPSLVFQRQRGGTGNGDVLFPLQFSPFPACQDRLLEDKDKQCLTAVTQGSGQCSSGMPGEAHGGH